MDDTRLGTLFRAVRIAQRLRQEDVARLAGVSQSSVSRIERGHIDSLPFSAVRGVAKVLEVRLDLIPSWRGGDLERVTNARHSAMHEVLAVRLANAPGWESAAEVSYSIYGERGVIDRLAFHAARRMLGLLEIEPDLSDPAGLVAQVDRYRRLALQIGRERGWVADSVSCWAVVADTNTNRRRFASHRELLSGAFPADGRAFGEWLRDPIDQVDGFTFLPYPLVQTGKRSLTTIKRVRLARPA